jgi:hypothetical protein
VPFPPSEVAPSRVSDRDAEHSSPAASNRRRGALASAKRHHEEMGCRPGRCSAFLVGVVATALAAGCSGSSPASGHATLSQPSVIHGGCAGAATLCTAEVYADITSAPVTRNKEPWSMVALNGDSLLLLQEFIGGCFMPGGARVVETKSTVTVTPTLLPSTKGACGDPRQLVQGDMIPTVELRLPHPLGSRLLIDGACPVSDSSSGCQPRTLIAAR